LKMGKIVTGHKMARSSAKPKSKLDKHEKGKGKSNHSLNPNRSKDSVKGVSNPRSSGTIKRLQMYRCSKAKRNADGKIIRPAPFQSYVMSGTQARVEPSRSWFSNTKVITQNALQKFQDDMKTAMNDPYQVVLRKTELPVSLLNERAKFARVHLLETESFQNTFGKKSHRKRPTIKTNSLEEMVKKAETAGDSYNDSNDKDRVTEEPDTKDRAREYIFAAGKSKRIWNELYKVIDSSDVLLQVLDARDPLGTRSSYIEQYLKKDKAHKHLVFVLNKVDLVPTWVTQKWVAILSAEYPTVAFHASIKHPFGKGALINLLRQFGKLHKDNNQISVGFLGYPNVGKSSVINSLRSKKVCNVAPIAGETKVWQYITLMRKIYLIDCPGVVYNPSESDEEKVLKGVVRVELVENPGDYISHVLAKVKREYMARTYKVPSDWSDHNDFLERVAQKYGKLLKGGEPDINTVAKMILNDWQRGKIPFFVPPVGCEMPPKNLEKSEAKDKKDKDQDFKQIKVLHDFDAEDLQDMSVEESKNVSVESEVEKTEEKEETSEKEAVEKKETEKKAVEKQDTIDDKKVEKDDGKKRKMEESPPKPKGKKQKTETVKTTSGVFIVKDEK